MANFTVTADGVDHRFSGYAAHTREGDVLVTDDGDGERTYWAPGYWQTVTERTTPEPLSRRRGLLSAAKDS